MDGWITHQTCRGLQLDLVLSTDTTIIEIASNVCPHLKPIIAFGKFVEHLENAYMAGSGMV